jgi:hypothetical protein
MNQNRATYGIEQGGTRWYVVAIRGTHRARISTGYPTEGQAENIAQRLRQRHEELTGAIVAAHRGSRA